MEHQTTLIRYPPTNNSLLSSGNVKKSSIAYEPRTEAISPAINDDILNAEDSNSKSTKDEQTLLVEKLKKVEAEIIQTDLQIVRLRRQKEQLEQAANSANKHDDDQENVCDTKQLSIAKLVYHENRAKAQKACAKLECLGGVTKDLPLYNQPSDNAIYHHNAAKFNSSFKTSLIACFRSRLQKRLKLEESVSVEYDRRMEKWLKSIETEDSQPNKRVRDAKTREFFEKQFPELKKARESGERFSRVGQRVARSDAELDELLDGITEREDQDKKVKSYAVIPPMLEEMRSRKPKFINNNGYVEDIVAQYKEYQILNTWTDEEKDIFRENYLQHPKNFGLIARMTTRKNVANCVQYYYLSKKSENYKQLLKRQQKRRTRSFVRPAQATPAIPLPEGGDTTCSNKTSNGLNEKQAGDGPNDTNGQNPSDQTDASKLSAFTDGAEIKTTDINMKDVDSENKTCCICSCEFSENNQFRNVTRSNHQLYGIGLDTLKPGMRICYSCRFRHVKHPSFDEPSVSPEPIEDDVEFTQAAEMMDVDTPVIKTEPEPTMEATNADNNTVNIPQRPVSPPKDLPPENQSGPSNGESNKGPQRTCVRDIIYQAIEMSFQKPKTTEAATIPSKPDVAPIRSDCVPTMSPSIQHSISNILPLKHVGPNHHIPSPLAPPPSHVPRVQNIGLDHHHQLQLEMQRQQILEYNLRQQQMQANLVQHQMQAHLVQQQQQQQHHQHQQQQLQQQHQRHPMRQQFYPRPNQPQMGQPMLPRHASQPVQLQTPPAPLRQPQQPPISTPPQQQQLPQSQQQQQHHHQQPQHPMMAPPLVSVPPPAHKPRPPPMAHGARGPKVAASSPAIMEDCVLNLSATPMVKSATPPTQPPPPPPPQPAVAEPVPPPPPAPVEQQPPPPPAPATAPEAKNNEHQEESPKRPMTPEQQQQPSRELEESRSPNLTGSPTSPSEMVIDESAGATSPASSTEHPDENQ